MICLNGGNILAKNQKALFVKMDFLRQGEKLRED